MKNIKVLIVTSEWPSFPGDISGIHVFDQADQLRAAGIDVEIFAFRGRKNPLRYAKAIIDFLRLDRKHFDVIHAHHGQSGVVALSQRTLPVVVTFHGSDLQGIRDSRGRLTILGHLLRLISRAVARSADKVILVSDHMKIHISRKDYKIIPAGVDLDLFSPMPLSDARSALSFSKDRRLVLFVGDPARTEKRFWLAAAAVERLKEFRMDAELIIANGIPHEMMPYYMSACDVLLITSSSEGSPSIVKEALASGLPIVSTDVGDVRKRIRTIEGCVICENESPEKIAEALLSVLCVPKRINGFRAVHHLDQHLVTEQIIQVYQEVTAKSRLNER